VKYILILKLRFNFFIFLESGLMFLVLFNLFGLFIIIYWELFGHLIWFWYNCFSFLRRYRFLSDLILIKFLFLRKLRFIFAFNFQLNINLTILFFKFILNFIQILRLCKIWLVLTEIILIHNILFIFWRFFYWSV
jgi:hypothetical protein